MVGSMPFAGKQPAARLICIPPEPGQTMTARDDTPSVDDDALASAYQANTGQGEEAAGSPASPAQDAGREGRIRELIHQRQVADAVAARSAAEAAALRNGSQAPGRPQDYRAPEDYT